MNRCKTCKHWTRKTVCEWMDDGECDRLMWSDMIEFSAIVGEIVTKADFGCVLWEARNKRCAERYLQREDKNG